MDSNIGDCWGPAILNTKDKAANYIEPTAVPLHNPLMKRDC